MSEMKACFFGLAVDLSAFFSAEKKRAASAAVAAHTTTRAAATCKVLDYGEEESHDTRKKT